MAKNTGKRRRHRNRPARKMAARWDRAREAMLAPIRQPRGYTAVGRKVFIVEPLGPGCASLTSHIDPTGTAPLLQVKQR